MQMTPYRDGNFEKSEAEEDFLGVNFEEKAAPVKLKPRRRKGLCALVAVCCASVCAVAAVVFVLGPGVPRAVWGGGGDDDDDDDGGGGAESTREAAFFSTTAGTAGATSRP